MLASAPTGLDDRHRNAAVAGLVACSTTLILGFISGIGALTPIGHLFAAQPPARGSGSSQAVGATRSSIAPFATTGATSTLVTSELPGRGSRPSLNFGPTATTASPSVDTITVSAPTHSIPGRVKKRPSIPAASPGRTPSPPGPAPGTAATCKASLLPAVMAPLIDHLEWAHLTESPAQQIAALLDLNSYLQIHTALLSNVLNPVFFLLEGLAQPATGGLTDVAQPVLGPLNGTAGC